MLASEFAQELGALIRSLEQKVRTEPHVRSENAIDQIDRAIIALVATRLELIRGETRP